MTAAMHHATNIAIRAIWPIFQNAHADKPRRAEP
jgi:hypothetical protein